MTDLWPHQREAVDFLRERHAGMLAMEMGTGKTLAALRTLEQWGARAVLIFAPLSVLPVWEAEVTKHSPDDWRAIIPNGSLSARAVTARRELARQRRERANSDAGLMIVINYEAVLSNDILDVAKFGGFDALVLDESHRIKAPGGKISRRCSQIADRIPRRLCLTGTPMPHSPLDIYAQYRALDKTIFGTSNTLFKARYAVMGGWENKQVVAYRDLEDLHDRMASASFRVRAADVLDLPGWTEQVMTCELEAPAAAAYRQMERTYVLELEQGIITAQNALSKLLRLQQITSGHLPLEGEDGEVRSQRVSTAKQRLLSETVEGMLPVEYGAPPEPIVVFARFIADLDAAREVSLEHGLRPAELSGRHNDLAAWQRGEADLLAVQIQAGGLGVDMSRARFAIYYSLGYSLGDLLQTQARLHRPGQTRLVTYAYLVARGTVDEDIIEALRRREQMIEYVVDQLREKGGARRPRTIHASPERG